MITPETFYERPVRRCTGVENEYVVQEGDNLRAASLLLARTCLERAAEAKPPIPPWIVTRSREMEGQTEPEPIQIWLGNGATFYLDGSHLEYCTQEVLGPQLATRADKAGMRLVCVLGQASESDIQIFRHAGTADKKGNINTIGQHDNLLIPTELIKHSKFRQIVDTYLATRVWAWAGMVGPDGYLLSQKAYGIGKGTIHESEQELTDGKAMARIKGLGEQELGAGSEWSRLEICFSENTFSSWAKFMNLATASLLMRMMELKHLLPKDALKRAPILENPVEAAHLVAKDLSLSRKLKLQDGTSQTALEIQTYYANLSQHLCTRTNLPPDEREAAHQWPSS